jgi:arabinose-5-phosphate isomerase
MNKKSRIFSDIDLQADAAITCGRRVITTEMDGLKALGDSLNSSFSQAVAVIHSMKQTRHGRLIVAGIGKSGHVARKLAATLASTGTPSFFVHPGEASHGDLGMITEHDVILLLSNSGENAELSDLIHYTRRFAMPLIAMTSKPESTLATHADIILQLPAVPEACPNGMAPTTSTTMMLALGDALAVALLERMGLTKDQFRTFHPGGKLGQQLLRVSDLMHKGEALPVVTPKAKMNEVLVAMSEKNLGVVLVMENNNLAGIFTDGDWKRHMTPNLMDRTVEEIMTREPRSVEASQLAGEAMGIMTRTPGQYVTSLIVKDEQGQCVGLIRLQDCLQAGIA